MRYVWLFALCLTSTFLNAQRATLKTPEYPDHVDLSYYLDNHGVRKLIDSKNEWITRRKHVMAGMQQVMGPFPKHASPVALEMQVHEEVRTEKYIRQLIVIIRTRRFAVSEPICFSPCPSGIQDQQYFAFIKQLGLGKKNPPAWEVILSCTTPCIWLKEAL